MCVQVAFFSSSAGEKDRVALFVKETQMKGFNDDISWCKVGRRDVTSSKSMAMELFQKSVGFTSFDLGLLVDRDIDLGGELMRKVDEHYRAGRIAPYGLLLYRASRSLI